MEERRAFRSIANRSDPESRLQINACGELSSSVHGPTWPLFLSDETARGCRRSTPSLGPPIDIARSRQACPTPIEHEGEARQDSPGIVEETVTDPLGRNETRRDETRRVFEARHRFLDLHVALADGHSSRFLPSLWEILWKLIMAKRAAVESAGRGE